MTTTTPAEIALLRCISTLPRPSTCSEISKSYLDSDLGDLIRQLEGLVTQGVVQSFNYTSSPLYCVKLNLNELIPAFNKKYEEIQKKEQQLQNEKNKHDLITKIENLEVEIRKKEDGFSKSQKYIGNLHRYNELKDTVFVLVELISKKRGVSIKEVLQEFDVKDIDNIKSFNN